MSPWPTHATRIAYENRWITVHEDQVRRPDGTDGVYGVVSLRHPAVFVVALTAADDVVLIDVDRHTVGRSLEVPAGSTDGQEPLVAAARELAEEAGLVAQEWTQLGELSALNGVCRAPASVYLATGLSPAPAQDVRAEEEGILAVRAEPWSRVLDLVASGEIRDSETLAALLHAAVHVGRVQ
ncbi:MAG: NUDIX domain-containing protein [Nostocoides sp.]